MSWGEFSLQRTKNITKSIKIKLTTPLRSVIVLLASYKYLLSQRNYYYDNTIRKYKGWRYNHSVKLLSKKE